MSLTLDPPIGLLAELTHRCPLQCPYCSNPLELERAKGELDGRDWARVLDEAAALGVLQLHLSGGEPPLRPDLEDIVARARGRALHQPHHRRRAAWTSAGSTRAGGGRPRPCAAQPAGPTPPAADRIGGYKGGHAEEAAGGRAGSRARRPAAHRQRRRAPAEPRPARGDDRARASSSRRASAGGRAYPVLRLGAAQPRRADAEPRPARGGDRRGRGARARAAQGPARHRLCRARLLRATAQALHGRLGAAVPQRHAGRARCCPAMPRRRIPGLAFDNVRERSLRWIWQRLAGLQALPRHRLDARALPLLRPARGRFRRLPLPGHGAHRRCRTRPIPPASCRPSTTG